MYTRFDTGVPEIFYVAGQGKMPRLLFEMLYGEHLAGILISGRNQ